MIKSAIADVVAGRDLSEEQARAVMTAIMEDEVTPAQFYIACRWDYDEYPKESLLQHMALVRAPSTGLQFAASPADWGPNSNTGRVADISPGQPRTVKVGEPESLISPSWEEPGSQVITTEPPGPMFAGRNLPMALLTAAGVPAGPINDIGEAFAFAAALGLDPVWEVDGVRGVRSPLKLSETPAAARRRPPALGEHDGELRAWLAAD